MPIEWGDFVNVIRSHDNFILTSHIRPDCDALGSELGMAGVLESLGKAVTIINGQSTPKNLAFIDPHNRIQTIGEDITPENLPLHDAVMVLDTSAWAQLGSMADVIKTTRADKYILDHHQESDDLDAQAFRDTTSVATGCLVLEAARSLGVTVTAKIATPLFAAVATDTGWFRYPAVQGDTYRVAAELIDAGANPADVYSELYERDTPGRVRLRGLILSRTEVELDGRLAHTYVLKDDFAATGAKPSDTEDVINMTLAISGTEAAVVFVEQLDGGCKLSFRSRCKMDCSQVARQFGGGGHKAAAGAFLDEPFQSAQSRVLDAVRAAVR